LYPAMVADLEAADAAFVLLVGDQVYADGLAPVSVRRELRRSGEREPSFYAALEAYRRVYRGYLGQAGFRALRERFPTCCMWDDHDIFNNWGSLLEETPLDRLMFAAACRAFVEYQHPRNPADPRVGPTFHFTFAWGDVGFLVLDLRGARDYESGHLLGRAQWEEVRRFLAGEAARSLQTLFVVSSVPLAHTARWVARLFSRLHERAANSVRDRWSSDAFVGARDALLDALLAWRAAAPGRQVIALSGDIHEASAWTIRPRRGPGAIEQFTSSALTNVPPRKQVALNWAVGLAPNLLEPRFRFERHFLRPENNFGLVQVTPLDGPGHRVDLQVRGWDPERRALRTVAHRVCLPAPPCPAGRPTP
ncbi:MAG: alkaline phosphatase family protein, partial [Thermomicrobiaceae bacterium]|nr:alkaline phosphatase family protein [Thermomicrobiaceae bacterium]